MALISMYSMSVIEECNKLHDEFEKSGRKLIEEYATKYNELRKSTSDDKFNNDEEYAKFCVLVRYTEQLERKIVCQHMMNNGYELVCDKLQHQWIKKGETND